MLHLDVLRHGATVCSGYYGTTEVPLNAAGHEQMRQAVQGRYWDGIITSPLRRCADFAEGLAAQLQLLCVADVRLREMHFGAWEGRSADQLMAADAEALGRFWRDPLAHPPPGAEPLPMLQERVLDFVADQLAASPGKRLLLVTHGGPIRILLNMAAGGLLSQLLHIDVAHAALSRLQAGRQASGPVRIQLVAG